MSYDRDWLQELKALDDRDEAAEAKAAQAIRESGALLTLQPDGIREHDVDPVAPLDIEIRLGDTSIGFFRVEDWHDGSVWIGRIAIDYHYQGHGFGTHAMGLLTAIARQEGYRLLKGEVERGVHEQMEKRRSFFKRCGFTVHDDATFELKLRRRAMLPPAPTEDWRAAPWFLDLAHVERLWSIRYEQTELQLAHAELAKLYPHDFCLARFSAVAQAGQPDDDTDAAVGKFRQLEIFAGFLRGLYEPQFIGSEVLAMGVDLATVQPAKPPADWLKRFTTPEGIRGADFEVQVWANALRSAIAIARIPEAKSKTPDFKVEWNERRYCIEAKVVETAEHDMMRFEHRPLIHPSPPDDREYHVEVAPEIRALGGDPRGRETYRRIQPGVEAALNRKRWELEEGGSPLGEHDVPGAGRITISIRDPEFAGRSTTTVFVSEASQQEKARRLLKPLQDAAAKFRTWPGRVGSVAVAMLDVPMDYNPEAVQRALLKESVDNRATYRDTDAIVWRRIALHMDEQGDPWKTYHHYACFVARLPWCSVPDAEIAELASHVLASPHRFFVPPRRRDQPDPYHSIRDKMRIFLTPIEH